MTDLLHATEIATLKGWRPLAQHDDDGWILSANGGAIGRLNSAAVLGPSRDPPPQKIARAETFFAAHHVPAMFRLYWELAPAEVMTALAAHGYAMDDAEVLAMARPVAGIAAPPTAVTISTAISEPWRAVFEGDGFATADSRARAETYARSPGMRYLLAYVGDQPAAAGLAAPFADLVGVHGMRTAPRFRGQGLATAIIAAIANEAAVWGGKTLFLHVEATNTPAARLYRALGFERIGAYRYWRKG